jgi:hypothetical protein
VRLVRGHDRSKPFGELGPASEDWIQIPPMNFIDHRVERSGYRRAAWLAGQQRHFTEDLTGRQTIPYRRQAATIDLDIQNSLAKSVQMVTGITLAHHRLARRQLLAPHFGCELGALGRVERPK